jgi:HEAT repeat protein
VKNLPLFGFVTECRSTPSIVNARPEEPVMSERLDDILERTRDADPEVRRLAAHHLCPCQLKTNHRQAWDRILELCQDDDLRVRKAVIHTLTDGSPKEREVDIVQALESMYNDDDRKLRRMVRQTLARYRATGKLNER